MFNEKKTEVIYENNTKVELEVWQSPKYIESKQKAIEIIKKYKDQIFEGDFWILMNKTKSNKMAYTGLIISHNGCLKLNDLAEEKNKFKPHCVTVDVNGFSNSLVFTYCSPEQGIYEIGEVNKNNCKNEYPYAMALKRCFDRVVLKISKLAYAGLYSESEADELKQDIVETETKADQPKEKLITKKQIETLKGLGFSEERLKKMATYYKVEDVSKITYKQAQEAIDKQNRAVEKAKAKAGANNG